MSSDVPSNGKSLTIIILDVKKPHNFANTTLKKGLNTPFDILAATLQNG